MSACKTLHSFLDCWSSCVSLFLTWSSCCSRFWWELCSWVSSYRVTETMTFYNPFKGCLSQQYKPIDRSHLSHLLTVPLLVLQFLLQSSSAALSVVPLTVHLIRHLFQLLFNWWTLKNQTQFVFARLSLVSAIFVQTCRKARGGIKLCCCLPLSQLAAVVRWPESVHVWSWSGLCPVQPGLCAPGSAESGAPAAWRPGCELPSREKTDSSPVPPRGRVNLSRRAKC